MLGLIIKDYLYLKNLTKNMLIIFIGTILVSLVLGNGSFAISVIPLIIITTGINTFQADEYFNTEIYTLTYPITRKEIVKSKYLYTLSLFGLGLLIGIIMILLFSFVDKNSFSYLSSLFILELMGLLFDFILYPIMYKYGCEKSSFILTSIIIFIILIMVILSNFISGDVIINVISSISFIFDYGVYILIILSLLVGILSYYISVKIYNKLDF